MQSVKTVEIPQLRSSFSFLDKVVDMPVVFNDTCPWVSVQKTAKVPQLQRSSQVADVPVCRSSWCRRCSAVVNVPVIMQRQVLLFQHGGASDSVHRQSRGHSSCATEIGTLFSADVYGGGDGAF